MISLIYGIQETTGTTKMKKHTKETKKKQTLKYREQNDGYQRTGGWVYGWNKGD